MFNPQAGNKILTTYTSNGGILPQAYLHCCNFWTVEDINTIFAPDVWIHFLYVYCTVNITWPARHLSRHRKC